MQVDFAYFLNLQGFQEPIWTLHISTNILLDNKYNINHFMLHHKWLTKDTVRIREVCFNTHLLPSGGILLEPIAHTVHYRTPCMCHTVQVLTRLDTRQFLKS